MTTPSSRYETSPKARLLDLFCCQGGATRGYQQAGFEVHGVDLQAQPRYIGDVFHQGDAISVGQRLLDTYEFDAIHASPPCKTHTRLKAFSGAHHVDLIEPTRELLQASGLPWVMENVPGAPLRDPVTLCGSMFGLGVRRHRLFESNLPLYVPACDHERQDRESPGYPVKRYHSGQPVVVMSPVIGVYGRGQGLGPGEVDLWRTALGIDWMNKEGMRECIPPAYTKHLGEQLMVEVLRRRGQAAA